MPGFEYYGRKMKVERIGGQPMAKKRGEAPSGQAVAANSRQPQTPDKRKPEAKKDSGWSKAVSTTKKKSITEKVPGNKQQKSAVTAATTNVRSNNPFALLDEEE